MFTCSMKTMHTALGQEKQRHTCVYSTITCPVVNCWVGEHLLWYSVAFTGERSWCPHTPYSPVAFAGGSGEGCLEEVPLKRGLRNDISETAK